MSTIVVGVDGSEESLRALRFAVSEARVHDAEIRAVNAWHVPALAYGAGMGPVPVDLAAFPEVARVQLEQSIEGIVGADSGVTVTPVVRQGQAAAILCEEAEGADLLVVGARGLGGFKGLLLGSVSQGCAQHATCPVMIVRNDPTESAAERKVA